MAISVLWAIGSLGCAPKTTDPPGPANARFLADGWYLPAETAGQIAPADRLDAAGQRIARQWLIEPQTLSWLIKQAETARTCP